MTCIVGIEGHNSVVIGGDSAASSGWTVRANLVPKVFRCNSLLIGITGSFRLGQVLEHHLRVRSQKDDETDIAYLVRAVIKAVRKCFKAQGIAKVENSVEEGGRFLLGYRGKLYKIDDDFQVNRTADGFNAIGCGLEYALGAMSALTDLQPWQRVERSLEIAAHFSGAVMGPFTILEAGT